MVPPFGGPFHIIKDKIIKKMKLKKLNISNFNTSENLQTKREEFKIKGKGRGRNKKDIYVKGAQGTINLKITSFEGPQKGLNWQILNENQRQFKSKKLIKSLYEGSLRGPINQLETRLDILVFRLNLATSLKEARDLIKKGFIQVNSAVIKYPGFYVDKIGALIKSTSLMSIKARLAQKDTPLPSYLYTTSPLNGILIYKPIYDSTFGFEGPLKFYHRSFKGTLGR